MKAPLTLLLLTSIMIAQPLTLEDILAQTKAQHPLFQAKEQTRLSLEAQSKADFASEPIGVSLGGGQASPDEGDDAFEYSLGISKTFAFGNTKALGLSAQRLQNEAKLLQKEKALILLSNRIQNLYHQSCLDKEKSAVIEASLQTYRTLYKKKQKAYKYQEISKKELLQLGMQMRSLKQKAQSSHASEKISQEKLYDLSTLDKRQPLSCQDITPIRAKISFDETPFLLSQSAFNKELLSLSKLEKRYSKSFDSIDIGASYDDEIDTKRVGVGFMIPLSFTSAKNEQNHISIMHKRELKILEQKNWMMEQTSHQKQLASELESAYNAIIMIEENHTLYQDTLMPLIEKSFRYGESSSLEYILGRQKLLELSQELIQTKKTYYDTLFKLYSLIEMEK